MRKQKSKHKETGQEMQDTADISHECLVVFEEKQTYGNYRIIMFRTFEYTGKGKCDSSYIQQPG